MLRRLLVVLFCCGGMVSAAEPRVEIEMLLTAVKHLEGATFVRNGTDHTPSAAAAHLRMKWEKQTAKVKSAEDFISLCATQSLSSGERYRIRFKDGTARDAAEVLWAKLAEIRKAPQRP